MDENRRRIIKQNIIDELLNCLNTNESEKIIYRGENNYLSGLISLLRPGVNFSKREFLIWYLTILQIEDTPILSIDYLIRLSTSYKRNKNFLGQLKKYAESNKRKKLPDEVWIAFMTSLLFDFEGGFIDAKIYIFNKVIDSNWEDLKRLNLRTLFRFILSVNTSNLLQIKNSKEKEFKNTNLTVTQTKINERWGFFFFWLNIIVKESEELNRKIDLLFSRKIKSYKYLAISEFTKEKEEFLNFIEPKLPPFLLAYNYSLDCITELSIHFQAQKERFLSSTDELIISSDSLYILKPLLGKYVLPEIFYNRFHKLNWSEKQSAFMLHALMGKPLHQFEGLPFKLTQKACHVLLTMPEFTRYSFWTNLAAAQLISQGVNRNFTEAAVALLERFQGRYDFWINVFDLLFKKGTETNELLNLCDYIRFVFFDLNQKIDLKNLSLNSLRMRSLEWHTNLRMTKTINKKLPLLDIKIFKYTDPNTDLKYCIRQLVTTAELYAEGQWMNHCVYTYTYDCLEANSFIFSLRNIDDKTQLPIVTIEVSKSKLILQKKGKYNREPSPFEDEVIAMWAKTNNLRINC
jgi:hypothetical protein